MESKIMIVKLVVDNGVLMFYFKFLLIPFIDQERSNTACFVFT